MFLRSAHGSFKRVTCLNLHECLAMRTGMFASCSAVASFFFRLLTATAQHAQIATNRITPVHTIPIVQIQDPGVTASQRQCGTSSKGTMAGSRSAVSSLRAVRPRGGRRRAGMPSSAVSSSAASSQQQAAAAGRQQQPGQAAGSSRQAAQAACARSRQQPAAAAPARCCLLRSSSEDNVLGDNISVSQSSYIAMGIARGARLSSTVGASQQAGSSSQQQ
jgi:hypothetical protein